MSLADRTALSADRDVANVIFSSPVEVWGGLECTITRIGDTFRNQVIETGHKHRLHTLLDRQDQGPSLTDAERHEAEGLVDLAEFLTLLRLRAERAAG